MGKKEREKGGKKDSTIERILLAKRGSRLGEGIAVVGFGAPVAQDEHGADKSNKEKANDHAANGDVKPCEIDASGGVAAPLLASRLIEAIAFIEALSRGRMRGARSIRTSGRGAIDGRRRGSCRGRKVGVWKVGATRTDLIEGGRTAVLNVKDIGSTFDRTRIVRKCGVDDRGVRRSIAAKGTTSKSRAVLDDL